MLVKRVPVVNEIRATIFPNKSIEKHESLHQIFSATSLFLRRKIETIFVLSIRLVTLQTTHFSSTLRDAVLKNQYRFCIPSLCYINILSDISSMSIKHTCLLMKPERFFKSVTAQNVCRSSRFRICLFVLFVILFVFVVFCLLLLFCFVFTNYTMHYNGPDKICVRRVYVDHPSFDCIWQNVCILVAHTI